MQDNREFNNFFDGWVGEIKGKSLYFDFISGPLSSDEATFDIDFSMPTVNLNGSFFDEFEVGRLFTLNSNQKISIFIGGPLEELFENSLHEEFLPVAETSEGGMIMLSTVPKESVNLWYWLAGAPPVFNSDTENDTIIRCGINFEEFIKNISNSMQKG